MGDSWFISTHIEAIEGQVLKSSVYWFRKVWKQKKGNVRIEECPFPIFEDMAGAVLRIKNDADLSQAGIIEK